MARSQATWGEYTNRSIFCLVDTVYFPANVDSVRSINDQADQFDGTVVSLAASLYQQIISVQEVSEETTGCGEDQVQIEEVCTDVLNDVVLHAGAAWNATPSSEQDVIPVFALWSRGQLTPQKTPKGTYSIIGEAVNTNRLDERLPDATVILAYDLDRSSDINDGSLGGTARTLIETPTQ